VCQGAIAAFRQAARNDKPFEHGDFYSRFGDIRGQLEKIYLHKLSRLKGELPLLILSKSTRLLDYNDGIPGSLQRGSCAVSSFAIESRQKDMPSERETKKAKSSLIHVPRTGMSYENRTGFTSILPSACLKTRSDGDSNRALCISEWEVPGDQSRISSQSGCGQSSQACIDRCVRRPGTG
jgi:hypothetical protein